MKSLCITAFLILSSVLAYSNETGFKALRAYAVSKKVSAENIKKGIEGAVWKTDKSAVAACFKTKGATLCIVAYMDGERYLISDVSNVESFNFGKLGFPRSHYTRFITEPVSWNESGGFIYTNFGGRAKHQILFRTRAWKKKQRYTVGEPLILDSAWKPLWR